MTLFVCPTNASCANYGQGINSDRGFTTATGSSTCPGSVDVVIPSGYVIDSVHTSYDFTRIIVRRRPYFFSKYLTVA